MLVEYGELITNLMEKKYRIQEVSEKQYSELAAYCNANKMRIDGDDTYYYLLLPSELLVNGEIVDNSEEYNHQREQRNNEAERSKLIAELAESDYKVIKCYECSLIGIELPYNIEDLHKERQLLRDKINLIKQTK